MLVGKIDGSGGLKSFLLKRVEFKLNGTIRKTAIAVVKITVDRPGKDHSLIRNDINDFLIVRIEHDFYIWMMRACSETFWYSHAVA